MTSNRPPLVLGTMCFGKHPLIRARPVDRAVAFRLLDEALERGIEDFDTADVYGDGAAETWLGEWMTSRGTRNHVRIRTKIGLKAGAGGWGRARSCVSSVSDSLKRLQLERIDTLALHVFPLMPVDSLARELEGLFDRGVFRRLSSVNEPTDAVARLNERLSPGCRVSAMHLRYNLFHREAEVELAQDELDGMELEAWSPRAAGLLTAAGTCVPSQWSPEKWQAASQSDALDRARLALHTVARIVGRSPDEVAIAWVLQMGAAATLGTRETKELKRLSAARTLELTTGELSALESAAPPQGRYDFSFARRVGSM